MKNRLMKAVLMAALLIAPNLAKAEQQKSLLDIIKERGTLVIGIAPDAPPHGSIGIDGAPVGFAPDLAKAVAEKLGVKLELKPITQAVPTIQRGDIDAVFGSTTPTREREEVVDFTIVYNWDYVVPLIRKDDSGDIHQYGPPKTVSTTKNNYAAELFKAAVPNGNVTYFEQYDDAVNALRAGQTNAVLLNRFSASTYAKRFGDEVKVGDAFFSDPQAIVLRQNDSKWRNYLNWTLQGLWASGEFAELYNKNYGYKPNFNLWSDRGLQPGIVK
ncbi:substrate-binding periplasmic protein [Mesorhizobium retamae]|uniref:Transporter substrate-binding domain-containing protein n=1 Tax=Mesorhizobium retamae TaxID=2912854 RepID=A0ABS9QD67_9HYPH|nr:transporter substrate-binding domain-containing protein [Mesorhizobium sp. IRAMC:0171]MCG7505360.1 transporter substrate-binding domain-containing protein [Mesorhizobium sp. IRAMC:0171]